MDQARHKTRRRAANFTRTEVRVLLHLTKKYKTQIDSRYMETNSNKLKEQAWQRLAQEFNSLPQTRAHPREAHILRSKFANLKKQRKRKPPPPDAGQAKAADDVMALFGDEASAENFDLDDNEVGCLKEEICEDDDLKPGESDGFYAKRDSDAGDEYFADEAKTDLLELQKRCLLEEHALKLQHMQEKHDQALRIQEEEAEEKLRQMREEHKLQMEILQLRKQCLLK